MCEHSPLVWITGNEHLARKEWSLNKLQVSKSLHFGINPIYPKNSNFKFNEKYFNKLVGTAIGTHMAPIYVTLTMGYYETKLYAICKVKWGKEIGREIEENWVRL